jgi:predicted ArsR family transcriptional regulator
VEPESKDAMQEPFKVHLETTPEGGHRWIFDGVVEAKIERGAATRRDIMQALAGVRLTAEALADVVKASVRTIKTHLAALAAEGLVDSMKVPGRAGRKLWMLVEAGDA